MAVSREAFRLALAALRQLLRDGEANRPSPNVTSSGVPRAGCAPVPGQGRSIGVQR